MKQEQSRLNLALLLLLTLLASVLFFAPKTSTVEAQSSGGRLSARSGITPVVSGSAEASHVFKAGPGGLYSAYVTTGSTAGFLLIFDATSAPVDGAVTPIDCVIAPANATTGVNYGSGPPGTFTTGITAVFSSTGCFTKTGSATAFFKGNVQ